ncbi:MAG: ethanolamine utilization protein EutN [Spirochaetes bacterium]|nr:ethanolamine utilization protein EutN [Spirochaetota bacterium]
MNLARVTGTVVATLSVDGVDRPTYLIVDPCDTGGRPSGKKQLVALDTVGAGFDEIVLISQGSSARQTQASDKKAVDAVVVGIVDMVDEASQVTYRK